MSPKDADAFSRQVAQLVRLLKPLEPALLKLERQQARDRQRRRLERQAARQPQQARGGKAAKRPVRGPRKAGKPSKGSGKARGA